MKKFSNFISENRVLHNVALNHLEDLPITSGIAGARTAVSFLTSLKNMLSAGNTKDTVKVHVKYNDFTSIICGHDPVTKKFFVGDSLITRCYSPEEIEKTYDGEHKEKMLAAFYWLPLLEMTVILEGDIMFIPSTLHNKEFEDETYLTFKGAKTLFAVPLDMPMAQRMKEAEIGVIFHTTRTGPDIDHLRASPGVDIGRLKATKKVWFKDDSFTDVTGIATLTTQEAETLNSHISQISGLFSKFNQGVINHISHNQEITHSILKFFDPVAPDPDLKAFLAWNETRLNREIMAVQQSDAVRNREVKKNELMNFYHKEIDQIKLLLDFRVGVAAAKNLIIHKLNQVRDIKTFITTDDGLKVIAPSGFVAIDLNDNIVKLVDRLKFEHPSFVPAKDWSRILKEETYKGVVDGFVDYCKDYLGLPEKPHVTISFDSGESVEHRTFGHFDRDRKIVVYAGGRHIMDVLRTLAHEITHFAQRHTDGPESLDGTTGSPHENEANTVAGIILRNYAKEHPELFDPNIPAPTQAIITEAKFTRVYGEGKRGGSHIVYHNPSSGTMKALIGRCTSDKNGAKKVRAITDTKGDLHAWDGFHDTHFDMVPKLGITPVTLHSADIRKEGTHRSYSDSDTMQKVNDDHRTRFQDLIDSANKKSLTEAIIGGDIARKEMPQIASADHQEYRDYMNKAHGIASFNDHPMVGVLKPTQKEVDQKKVDNMTVEYARSKPILITKDNDILDGHHRWKKLVDHNPYQPVPAIRLNTDIETAIEKSHKFPKAFVKK